MYRRVRLTVVLCISLLAVTCLSVEAQVQWTTNWTTWYAASPQLGFTLNNGGSSLVMSYTGGAWNWGAFGPLVQNDLAGNSIPAANRFMRVELTLGGWATALSGYTEYVFTGDRGYRPGKIACNVRYYHGAGNEGNVRLFVWPSITTRQILVVDMDDLGKWYGDEFSAATVTAVSFEMPWQGNNKQSLVAQWAGASTTFNYVGFFSTAEAATIGGNGQLPTTAPDGSSPPWEIDPDNPANLNGLPAAYDRGLGTSGLPGISILPGTVTYGFGTAVGPDGSVYEAEFGGAITRTLPKFGQLSLLSERLSFGSVAGGLFCIVMDGSGNLYYSTYATNEVRRLGDNKLILGGTRGSTLQRPDQLAVDSSGNVYAAWEASNLVQKWTASSDTITTLATSVPIVQGVGVLGGTVYYTQYLSTDPRCQDYACGVPLDTYMGGASMNGAIWRAPGTGDPPTGVVVSGATVDQFYRNRGMATDGTYLYVCEEANAWDQGNSARLSRYNPSTGTVTTLTVGADYPQFPTYSAFDGKLYFTLARDYRPGAFDPNTSFVSQSTGIANVQMALRGGNWNSGAGTSVTITAADPDHLTDQITLTGTVSANAGVGVVAGWIRVPDSYFPQISKTQLAGDADGRFTVPVVATSSSPGQCQAFALPIRHHGGARWPAQSCGAVANPSFSETPNGYLIYFEVSRAVYPESLSVIQGSLTSGSLPSSVMTNEDSYLAIRSQTSGTTRYATTDFTINAQSTSVQQGRLQLSVKASTTSVALNTYLWNYTTGVYDLKDTVSSLGTSEVMRVVDLTSLSNYVNASGNMKIRTQASRSGSTTFTVYHDVLGIMSINHLNQ